jgi:hypothetical protein
MKAASVPKRAVFLEAFIWLAGIAIAVWLLGPEGSASPWLPPCPFHTLTGLDCPGCGSTRALRALLHGHWIAVLDFNLLLLPGLLMFACGVVQRWSRSIHTLWQHVNRPNVVLVVVLCFWILRNLPFKPFLWLSAGH